MLTQAFFRTSVVRTIRTISSSARPITCGPMSGFRPPRCSPRRPRAPWALGDAWECPFNHTIPFLIACATNVFNNLVSPRHCSALRRGTCELESCRRRCTPAGSPITSDVRNTDDSDEENQSSLDRLSGRKLAQDMKRCLVSFS